MSELVAHFSTAHISCFLFVPAWIFNVWRLSRWLETIKACHQDDWWFGENSDLWMFVHWAVLSRAFQLIYIILSVKCLASNVLQKAQGVCGWLQISAVKDHNFPQHFFSPPLWKPNITLVQDLQKAPEIYIIDFLHWFTKTQEKLMGCVNFSVL